MHKSILLLFLIASGAGYAQSLKPPSWFQQAYKMKGLDKKYELDNSLTPAFIQSDFNGDKYQDVAVLVTNTSDKKKGIIIIHGHNNEVNIFGAGKDFGNGGDNFNWIKKWKSANGGIEVMNDDEIGGLIRWNGKNYIWKQQGD